VRRTEFFKREKQRARHNNLPHPITRTKNTLSKKIETRIEPNRREEHAKRIKPVTTKGKSKTDAVRCRKEVRRTKR